jgi:hypothetical protein
MPARERHRERPNFRREFFEPNYARADVGAEIIKNGSDLRRCPLSLKETQLNAIGELCLAERGQKESRMVTLNQRYGCKGVYVAAAERNQQAGVGVGVQ